MQWSRVRTWGAAAILSASIPLGSLAFPATGLAATPKTICGDTAVECDVTITTALDNGLYVTMSDNAGGPEGRAVVYRPDGPPGPRQFAVRYQTDGRFMVSFGHGSNCLDQSTLANGPGFGVQRCSYGTSQMFTAELVPGTTATYVLETTSGDGKCVDLVYGHAVAGASVGTYNCTGSANQQWVFHLKYEYTKASLRTPNAVPGTNTPNVADGSVEALEQVGSRTVAGGTGITAVYPPGVKPGSGTAPLPRTRLFAFDTATGQVDPGFVPQIDGDVNGLLAGPVPNTVYVLGEFGTVNGARSHGLALLDLTTGKAVAGFTAPALDGSGYAARLVNGHLLVGGSFTTAGGAPHAGLVSLEPTTGAVQDYTTVQLTVHHNYTGQPGQANGRPGIREMDVTSDGKRLVAVGNFKFADGVLHDQIVQLDLNTTTATVNSNWNTAGFTARCYAGGFDSYVEDVAFSPDDSYFVVGTAGANSITDKNTDGTRTLCDSVSRWNTADAGANVQPKWFAHTGDDSIFSVAVSPGVVYAGGHQRWFNNPDANVSGPGSIARPGLVALDPANGLPLAWNPGRDPRGHGAMAIYPTSDGGVYVGSDTDYIGNNRYFRGRIAYFPASGGTDVSVPAPVSASAESRLYTLSNQPMNSNPRLPSGQLRSVPFDGTTFVTRNAGPYTWPDSLTPNAYTLVQSVEYQQDAVPAWTAAPNAIDWDQARGAFTIGNTLYYGWSDGNLYKRSFDGAHFGPAVALDPYHDPAWDNVVTGSGPVGSTYRGNYPSLFGAEMQKVTGMFYADGQLYYSLGGQSRLRYRAFSPDSGAVGQTEYVAAGTTDFSSAAGLTADPSTGRVYFALSNDLAALHWASFNDGAPTGDNRLPGSAEYQFTSRGMFLYEPRSKLSFTWDCTPTASECNFQSHATSDLTNLEWRIVRNPVATYSDGYFRAGPSEVLGNQTTLKLDQPGFVIISLSAQDASGRSIIAQQSVQVVNFTGLPNAGAPWPTS